MPSRSSYRAMVAGLACLGLGCVLAVAGSVTDFGPGVIERRASAATPPVRQSWQAFASDPARVKAFRRGVGVMKERSKKPKDSADYRRSWEYWASAHSFYGSANSGPIESWKSETPKELLGFYDGLKNMTVPPDPPGIGDKVWDGCQHTGQNRADNFFAWHRLYLYFFERVLAEAAGEPSLRLPYWDYTDLTKLQIPTDFSMEKIDGQLNPLFDPRRTSQTMKLSELETNPDDMLGESDFFIMQQSTEFGIHGNVHCALGNGCYTPLMGQVPAAALDPLFWLHHNNLDRLWECWHERGFKEPSGDFRNAEYFFVDETGSLVSRKVEVLFGPEKSTYAQYDKVKGCSREQLPPPGGPGPPTTDTPIMTLASAEKVRISGPRTLISMSMPAGDVPQAALRAALDRPDGAGRVVEIVLDDISAARPPGAGLHLYVESTANAARREYAGTINFFGLKPGDGRTALGTRRFSVTKALRELKVTNLSDVRVVVEIAPTGMPNADAAPAARLEAAAVEIGRARIVTRARGQ